MEVSGVIKPKKSLAANFNKKNVTAVLGFEVREIHRDRRQFEIAFTADKFESDIRLFRIVIPKDTHKLGSNYAVRKIMRTDSGKDSNIWIQYEMLVNGDFVMYSEDKFDGKIVLEEV